MEATVIKSVSWKGTLLNMEVGSHLDAGYKQENYMRYLASRLKKDGYRFSVTRTEEGIRVVCVTRPER